MISAPELPTWAACLAGLLLLFGSALTCLGALGLVRFRSFYDRVHAPTLGATLGTTCILAGSMLCSSMLEGRLVLQDLLILALLTLTTPIGLILLARAALYRDRSEGNDAVPADE